MNIECFDKRLNAQLTDIFGDKKRNAVIVTAKEMNDLPNYKKLRNNLFRLFSPYM